MEIRCSLCGNLTELTGRAQKYCPQCAVTARRRKQREKYALEHQNDERIRRKQKMNNGRFSGRVYENTPERLEAIRQRYSNGVTLEMIEDMVRRLV